MATEPAGVHSQALKAAEIEQQLQQQIGGRGSDIMQAVARCFTSSVVTFAVGKVVASADVAAVHKKSLEDTARRNAAHKKGLQEATYHDAVQQIARECVLQALIAAQHVVKLDNVLRKGEHDLMQTIAEQEQKCADKLHSMQDSLEEAHEKEVLQLKQEAQARQMELQKQLIKLSGDVDESIQAQSKEHAAVMAKLEAAHDSVIDEVKQSHSLATAHRLGTERELRAQLLILREAGGELEQGHQQAVAELQASVSMEIEERNAVLTARRNAQHVQALQQEQEEREAALVRMEGEFMASMGELEAEHALTTAAAMVDHVGRESELRAQLLVLPLMRKQIEAMAQEHASGVAQAEGHITELRSQLLALPLVPKLLAEVYELRQRSLAVPLLLRQLSSSTESGASNTSRSTSRNQRHRAQHQSNSSDATQMQAEIQMQRAQLLGLPLMARRVHRLERTATGGAASAIPLLLSRLRRCDGSV
jgi:hypothetical protein